MAEVRVNSAFLANHAEVHDGLVFALGAFPEWWTVSDLPADVRLCMVVVLDLVGEPESEFTFHVSLARPTREMVLLAQIDIKRSSRELAPEVPDLFPLAVPFGIQFQHHGRHEFMVNRDEIAGKTVARVPLWVRPTETPATE